MISLKKIIFCVLLIAIWYYLLSSYFKSFKTFQIDAKKVKSDKVILFKPKSGRGVLPIEVQIALFAIDSFNLKDYNLYKSFGDYKSNQGNAVEIYQRINESAWPVKIDSNSRNLFGFTNEISTVPGIKIKLNYNNISFGTY
jgi:hypothetical protein